MFKHDSSYHEIEILEQEIHYKTVIEGKAFDEWSGTFSWGKDTIKNIKPETIANMLRAQLSRIWFRQMGPLILTGKADEELKVELEKHYGDVRLKESVTKENI